MITTLPCLAVSLLLSVLPQPRHQPMRPSRLQPDTILVADSVPPLLTEDLLARLTLFGKSVRGGQGHRYGNVHLNAFLVDVSDTIPKWVPITLVVPDTTLHFLKRIENNVIAAATQDTTVANGLTQAGLTSAQAQTTLLALWIAHVTINSAQWGTFPHVPTPEEAQTVYWRNVDFVREHQAQVDNFWFEYGFDVGVGTILSKRFVGPAVDGL